MTDLVHRAIDTPTRGESRAYVGIYLASFVVLLLIALVGQLLFLRWRAWLPGAEGGQSLVGSVRSAVYTFMSYLN